MDLSIRNLRKHLYVRQGSATFACVARVCLRLPAWQGSDRAYLQQEAEFRRIFVAYGTKRHIAPGQSLRWWTSHGERLVLVTKGALDGIVEEIQVCSLAH